MNNNVPMTLSDIERLANIMAKSQLFGCSSPEQVMALMAIAQAEGKHPATASLEYNIIKGRPALKADAMLARFQESGGMVKWIDYTDKRCAAEFSHSKYSPTPILIDWDMERAKNAGITFKDNWKNYPRQMLKARVISEGVRATYPGVCIGVYTPEEVQDFPENKDDRPDIKMPEMKTIVGPLTTTGDCSAVTSFQETATNLPAKPISPEDTMGLGVIGEAEVTIIKKAAAKGGYTSADVAKYIKSLGYADGKVKDLNMWDYEDLKAYLEIPKADRERNTA